MIMLARKLKWMLLARLLCSAGAAGFLADFGGPAWAALSVADFCPGRCAASCPRLCPRPQERIDTSSATLHNLRQVCGNGRISSFFSPSFSLSSAFSWARTTAPASKPARRRCFSRMAIAAIAPSGGGCAAACMQGVWSSRPSISSRPSATSTPSPSNCAPGSTRFWRRPARKG